MGPSEWQRAKFGDSFSVDLFFCTACSWNVEVRCLVPLLQAHTQFFICIGRNIIVRTNTSILCFWCWTNKIVASSLRFAYSPTVGRWICKPQTTGLNNLISLTPEAYDSFFDSVKGSVFHRAFSYSTSIIDVQNLFSPTLVLYEYKPAYKCVIQKCQT